MPHYISTMKINNIDGRTIPARAIVELTEEKARPFLASKSLEKMAGEVTKAETEKESAVSIPEDFPHRKNLIAKKKGTRDFKTLEDLRAASDTEIEAKDNIGYVARKEIREALESDEYKPKE